jgi:hypothetical protein
MRTRFPIWILLSLAGCGTLWPSVSATTASPRNEVFECARAQVESLGYSLTRNDRADGYLEGRKLAPIGRHRPYQEVRRFDVLSIQVSREDAGVETRLVVEARSFSEQSTRRGPTVTDEKATPAVKADAQALLEQCGR